MNEKRFILVIFLSIALTLVISIIVCVNAFSKNTAYDINGDSKYSEENAFKTKQLYSTDEMKDEFVQTFEEISGVLTSKLLDGSVTNEQELAKSIKDINNNLLSNDWTDLGLTKPTKWIGTWYLSSDGFLKFKFSSKVIEPKWASNENVSEYIVLN